MLRLHSHSSRSYPGRPARFATPLGVAPVMATCRGTGQESAEAIAGARKQARKRKKAGKALPRWSEKAFREFKRKVKELTGRSWFVSMDFRYKKLAEHLRGWMNYFGISEYYKPIPEIDQWLRRRLRMGYFKQWRWAKTKVRELRKLGTSLHAAISVAISRKGPWRLSWTPATQTGMIPI